jgi:hypothetical protein
MGVITESVEISRRPEEVFPYVADPSHFPGVGGAGHLG